jgi:hypothetical protein
VVFAAPKHHGKSTLAQALSAAGAELLSDDAVPVCAGETATILPGIRRVRLWSDSAARLGAGDVAAPPRDGDKHLVQPTRILSGTGSDPIPLSAIYLLAPVAPGHSQAAAQRSRLPAMEATMALIGQMKLGALLGRSESGRVLRFCAELADRVPVYRLEIIRDFGQLDAVVASIAGWHSQHRAATLVG